MRGRGQRVRDALLASPVMTACATSVPFRQTRVIVSAKKAPKVYVGYVQRKHEDGSWYNVDTSMSTDLSRVLAFLDGKPLPWCRAWQPVTENPEWHDVIDLISQ